MPVSPKIVRVTVSGYEGGLEPLVSVSLALSSETLVASTGSDGVAVFNLAEFSNYAVGDTVTVSASKTGRGRASSSFLITSEPTIEVSVSLLEESDLSYHSEIMNLHKLLFVLPTTFDGRKVTHANPLPVVVVDERSINANRGLSESMTYTSQGLVEYHGKALPGTAKSSAKWQIKKMSYSGFNVVDVQFAEGSDAFDKVWDSRADYSYS